MLLYIMEPIQTKPNTLYAEIEALYKDIISIHNSVVSVANQLWYTIPMPTEKDVWCDEVPETTVRVSLGNIKELVSITKDWAKNLEDNVR